MKLVEIQTKVGSVIPYLLGTVYSLYHFNAFNLTNALLMFISLLCIDMATTSINNYMDYKKANKKQGYGYESHNAIVRDNISETIVVTTIISLLFIATFFGVLLYINTNLIVLLLGAVSFVIGILYSFGPVPISRTPFGELFSGLFMGFLIPFIAVYIHIYDENIIDLVYSSGQLNMTLNVMEIIKILLIAIPAVIGIANIMLANNICDIDEDIENKRYTLPIYIGRENALKVFKYLYYISFLAVILALIFKILPLASIVTIFTFFIIHKNIKTFYNKQSKEETFVLAVKNFILLNFVLLFTIILDILIRNMF